MQQDHNRGLIPFIFAVALVLFGTCLAKGGFYIGKHEGDTMQLAEIVLRIARGEWPHLDFMTPIGYLAMAPIAWFVRAGAGMGHAIFYGQMLVAMVLLLPAAWVVRSRIDGVAPRVVGYAYGAFVMVLCLALVHGEAQISPSISMHYNRWAWAITYVIVTLVLLAPRGAPRPWLDGMIIGAGMAALVLIKATYFAALAPGVIIALLARRSWKTMAFALLAGLAVALVITLAAGVEFWFAYLADLRTVAGSEVRPQPGESFLGVAGNPAYFGGSLALVAVVIFLRQAGRMTEGMVLLFLVPAFIYITYQNYGNDPQWLPLLAMFAFVLRPESGETNSLGWDLRQALTITAAMAIAFGLPSAANLTFSPFRHYGLHFDKPRPILSRLVQHSDLVSEQSRLYGVLESHAGDEDGMPYARYKDLNGRKDVAVLNGQVLAYCEQQSGMAAWFEAASDDLMAAGYTGKRIVAADLFSAFWMYGEFEPVRRAAPWYYGGLSGLENADYILVPTCPTSNKVRAQVLKALNDGGYQLTVVHTSPLYLLITANKAP